jgi:hypothetical protein
LHVIPKFIIGVRDDLWGTHPGLICLRPHMFLACGTPAAAFPVLGPIDVIGDSRANILHENLEVVCIRALDVPREKARHYAGQFSWGQFIDQFVRNPSPATPARERQADEPAYFTNQASSIDRQ